MCRQLWSSLSDESARAGRLYERAEFDASASAYVRVARLAEVHPQGCARSPVRCAGWLSAIDAALASPTRACLGPAHQAFLACQARYPAPLSAGDRATLFVAATILGVASPYPKPPDGPLTRLEPMHHQSVPVLPMPSKLPLDFGGCLGED